MITFCVTALRGADQYSDNSVALELVKAKYLQEVCKHQEA